MAALLLSVPLLSSGAGAQISAAPPASAWPVSPVPASATSPAAPAPARGQNTNLATALKNARPLKAEVALAVEARQVGLPPDTEPPDVDVSAATVADTFGRLFRSFGSVNAVAPPTMVLLNSEPGVPTGLEGIPPSDALKLLAASLSEPQWQALTGERGLGWSDLQTDDQRALFSDILPSGDLHVQPVYSTYRPWRPDDQHDVTADRPQARLRLSERVDLQVPYTNAATPGTPINYYSWMGLNPSEKPGAPPRYQLNTGYSPQTALFGVPLRAEVPNEPKSGQLDFHSATLHVPVTLAGLTTVGSLMDRVSKATRMEIYADKRYEDKTLTVVGRPAAAPAGDLLRAVAFCLTGTYRHVGAAYVLTDDLVGYGTRRQILVDFEQDINTLRRKPLEDAGDALVTNHAPSDLHVFGDTTFDLSPEEQRLMSDTFSWNPFNSNFRMPFGKLTAAQQQAARDSVDQWMTTNSSMDQRPTLSGDVMLNIHPALDILFPSVNGPVEDGMINIWGLFQTSAKLQNERWQAEQKRQQHAPAPAAVRTPMSPRTGGPRTVQPAIRPDLPPSLAQTFQTISRRVVLAAPQTAADVDSLVASMKTIGLNQLWLKVFPATASSSPGQAPAAKETAADPDLLAEALHATDGTGIAVFPVMDLLSWGPNAPESVRDLTLLGDTSVQAEARRRHRGALGTEADIDPILPSGPVLVSPFVPEVQDTLVAQVKALLAKPGVAGLVWRETLTPGYDMASNGYSPDNFGYTEPARLAFLRKAHVDPVDIAPSYGSSVDTRLPNFGDGNSDWQLQQLWNKFLSDGNVALLRTLYAAAQPADQTTAKPAGRSADKKPRIFVKQRHNYWMDWYGTWDSARSPLPSFSYSYGFRSAGPPMSNEADVQAKQQSRVAVILLQPWGLSDPSSLANQLRQSLSGKRWDGFVLDLTSGNGSAFKTSAEWLATLAAAMKPAQAPKSAAK